MTYSIKSKQNAVIYNHLEAYCRENESRPLNFNACSALKKKKIEEGVAILEVKQCSSNHSAPLPISLSLPTFVETN